MTITDHSAATLVAMVAIINADTALQTLFGRTTDLCVAADTLTAKPTPPIIVFSEVGTSPAPDDQSYDALGVEFSCYAESKAVASAAIARLKGYVGEPLETKLFSWSAFNARSADAVLSKEAPPLRQRTSPRAELGDAAPFSADLALSFLIPA